MEKKNGKEFGLLLLGLGMLFGGLVLFFLRIEVSSRPLLWGLFRRRKAERTYIYTVHTWTCAYGYVFKKHLAPYTYRTWSTFYSFKRNINHGLLLQRLNV